MTGLLFARTNCRDNRRDPQSVFRRFRALYYGLYMDTGQRGKIYHPVDKDMHLKYPDTEPENYFIQRMEAYLRSCQVVYAGSYQKSDEPYTIETEYISSVYNRADGTVRNVQISY